MAIAMHLHSQGTPTSLPVLGFTGCNCSAHFCYRRVSKTNAAPTVMILVDAILEIHEDINIAEDSGQRMNAIIFSLSGRN